MKAIVLIGVIALVALGIFAVLSQMQQHSTQRLAQDDATGFFREKKQEKAAAEEVDQEAVKQPISVPAPSAASWIDRFENVLGDCVRTIKNLPTRLGLRSRPSPIAGPIPSPTTGPRAAPAGVYFTLIYLSARTPSGITGFEPGTRVVCIKDEGPMLLVQAGNLQFEAKRQYLTNDLDVANLAVRDDAEAQQALTTYIAQQQQAIDQRDNRRKMQPPSQH